jgi:alkylation response protein AidB-like acyl-CoA dehydrogenase
MLRLTWALSYQDAAETALDLLGPAGLVSFGPDSVDGGDALYVYYEARSRTIASGTAEIQKNVIAERVLGLPR